MSNNNSTSGGAGFTSLLLVAFIVLKLTGVIDWSWWWVLSPAWITAGVAVLVIGGIFLHLWIKGRRQDKKIVDKQGQLKSKWQERLDQMKEAQEKAKQK